VFDCRQLQIDRPQLEATLQRELRGRVRDLRLQVEQGGLILLGCCASYHSKQLAQHALLGLTDCPIVANRIEVCISRV
jgi:hypothetical protein